MTRSERSSEGNADTLIILENDLYRRAPALKLTRSSRPSRT